MPRSPARASARSRSRTRSRSRWLRNRRVPRLKVPGDYTFTRYAESTIGTGLDIQNPGTVSYTASFATFALSSVQGYADFVNLFDLYKINHVDLKIWMRTPNPDNTQASANIGATYYPKLWYCIDYDDQALNTLAQMKERQGVKCAILRPNSFIKVRVYPKFQKMVYKTLTSTGYGPGVGYLDTNQDYSVPHYAIKFGLDMNDVLTGVNTNVRVEAKYNLSFKNPQ